MDSASGPLFLGGVRVGVQRYMKPIALCALILVFGLCLGSRSQTQETVNKAPEAATRPPSLVEAHFHHLHLNTTDPVAAINFYTSKFDCEKGRFAGLLDAVWAQKSWLLFNKVPSAPPWELTSAVWHFGWGAEDMKSSYQKQLDTGTRFFTPLTDISEMGRAQPGSFYYAYVQGPDNALIELNTASHHRFGHLHLFSEDPVSAGELSLKNLGAMRRGNPTAPPSREPRFFRDHQIGPSMSLMMDNVNIIIYPIQYSRKAYADHWKSGQKEMVTTKGRVVDHVGFSVDKLEDAAGALSKAGVKLTDPIRSVAGGKIKYTFIEGPDKIRIELIDGHARKE
jgi:hypothetical protein